MPARGDWRPSGATGTVAPVRVLLMSPVAGVDPPGGDLAYTEALLARPPDGVVYTTYVDALAEGSLVERGRRAKHGRMRPVDVPVLAARVAEHGLRRAGVLFREPYRYLTADPDAYDLVHAHVFPVRPVGPGLPMVTSSGMPLPVLYEDRFAWTHRHAALAGRGERLLSAAVGAEVSSFPAAGGGDDGPVRPLPRPPPGRGGRPAPGGGPARRHRGGGRVAADRSADDGGVRRHRVRREGGRGGRRGIPPSGGRAPRAAAAHRGESAAGPRPAPPGRLGRLAGSGAAPRTPGGPPGPHRRAGPAHAVRLGGPLCGAGGDAAGDPGGGERADVARRTPAGARRPAGAGPRRDRCVPRWANCSTPTSTPGRRVRSSSCGRPGTRWRSWPGRSARCTGPPWSAGTPPPGPAGRPPPPLGSDPHVRPHDHPPCGHSPVRPRSMAIGAHRVHSGCNGG